MVAILEKGEFNSDFHPMVDFIAASPLRQYTRRARIAQSSALPTIADEHASLVRDVSEGEACPTDSGFIADQDRATIAKSSTLPHDSAPRVTSPATDEGSMQHHISELTALCTSLQRVKVLEDKEDVAATQSGDDAPIKGRSINEGEAAAERISNDSEERFKDFKGMTFEEIEAKFDEVWKQVEDFIPMGPKEETERLKRKDLLKQLDKEDLNQLWALVKEYLSIRPA
nr:hypothetical protein [Tanacetum cinerariifolium]